MSIFDVDIHIKRVSNNLKKWHCVESILVVDNYSGFHIVYKQLMWKMDLH